MAGIDRHYTLVCSLCGARGPDDGTVLDCAGDHGPALLGTEYAERRFVPDPAHEGVFRYWRWLPVVRSAAGTSRIAVYQSRGLASTLGLSNLWVAFNGYWPERGADLDTGTFKELEAHTVLGRLPESGPILTVASSGNTGAAFAWTCSQREIPCLIVVPGSGLSRLRFPGPLHPSVRVIVIDDGDYPDAIDLVAAISRRPGFQAEGGVRNVGRRDGLATVQLAAFEAMGRLPTHYFQAVGSGTGSIAVLEAAKRISAAEGGLPLPRLMLCQNLPFTPILDAWRMGVETLIGESTESFREAIAKVHADELTNWTPPYAVRGGVYDALMESGGDVFAVDNAEIRIARAMFAELEGIDIEPAAGVAVAALRNAVSQGRLDRDSIVLLNITGGGRNRLATDRPLVPVRPRLRLTMAEPVGEELVDRITARLG